MFNALRWQLVLTAIVTFNPPLADAQDIYERSIMSQPFEAEPFRQVRVPAWLQSTLGCGYTLSIMDKASRERAVEHGVKISEMGFVNPFFACYESKFLKSRSPDFPPGKMEQEVAEYKRLGVRILAVYPPCLQGEVYETRPQWRHIATNTTVIPSTDMKQFPHGGMLCLLGPYSDFMIDVLAEILTKFPDVDAFSFDGLHYGGVCYCEHCRTNYRAETNQEIPDADLRNPEFRRYQHWADRRMENVVQRMQQRLKTIKPEVALVTWSTNAGRFGHFLSIPRNMPARMNLLFDAPDQEFWLDESNRGTTIVPAFANAYIWATTNHRVAFSEPYLMSHGNPYGKDSFPPHEVLRRMMLAITYGTAPSIAVAQPARLQDAVYDCLDEVQRRSDWLTHKSPEPWAAIVMSDNTRNFYGQNAGLVEERYLGSVLGTFRAAIEEHLPITVINDWNLNKEDLERYKVLILPNTACLDTNQLAAIESFVSGGGGLVASLDASLFDEFGNARDDFGLKSVFGVSHRGVAQTNGTEKNNDQIDANFAKALTPDYWERRKNVFDFKLQQGSAATSLAAQLENSQLQTYVGTEAVTLKGPAVVVSPSTSLTAATAVIKSTAGGSEFPAIVTREHGQGRVVYFAVGMDAGYYSYSYPYQRIVLKEAIEWAARTSPPILVKAPMCVHSTFMRQSKEGKQRLIVHLYNDVNTTAHHALPIDDVPLREEVIPIHNIEIRFDGKYAIRAVYQQPEGVKLETKVVNDMVSVSLPKLEVHTMVVCEM